MYVCISLTHRCRQTKCSLTYVPASVPLTFSSPCLPITILPTFREPIHSATAFADILPSLTPVFLHWTPPKPSDTDSTWFALLLLCNVIKGFLSWSSLLDSRLLQKGRNYLPTSATPGHHEAFVSASKYLPQWICSLRKWKQSKLLHVIYFDQVLQKFL